MDRSHEISSPSVENPNTVELTAPANPASAAPPAATAPATILGSKRAEGRPDQIEPAAKAQRSVPESSGAVLNNAIFLGSNVAPEMIFCHAGEDVALKILLFALREDRSICILTCSGTISSVTLRQSTSSLDTVTYEGCFLMLRLTGAFMPTPNEGPMSQAGGMNLTMSGPDGLAIAGGVTGEMIADGPVTIVVTRF